MAIIAVLVAIAVPLFVGELGDAEKSVKDANIRTVRSEATIYLLKASPKETTESSTAADYDAQKKGGPIFTETGAFNQFITVTATVGNTGEVKQLTFAKAEEDAEDTCVKDKDGNYAVTVTINTEAAMKGTAATGAGG